MADDDSTHEDTTAQTAPSARNNQVRTGWFRKREWGHIRGTRVRTSTAILVITFFVLLWVYGYTTQRYGVVDETTPQRAPATTQQTYETTSTTSRSSSSSATSTSISGSSGVSGASGTEPAPPAPGVTETTTSVPGIPFPIPIPGLNGTTQTTTPAR